jgi:SpoVK/Ycf46/Vps4 family AAA+-type ATPase
VRGDLLKQLVLAHTDGDDAAFRKAAIQLAAAEGSAGHIRLAEDLRAVIARMARESSPKRLGGLTFETARPPGEVGDLLETRHPAERLRDLVLPRDTEQLLIRVLHEHRSRARLEKWGVTPRKRLLFHGPPGCGKTLAAAVLAGELGLPLMTVRFDSLFSRFLGATANHLRLIFNEMPRRPGVYLFDEFDAVAKRRGDGQDIGEMRRIVTSFLQLVDSDRSASVLVAATNHLDLLDHAVFRRFDLLVPFENPGQIQLEALLVLRLKGFRLKRTLLRRLAKSHIGLSYADASRACEDAIRGMVLEGREALRDADLAAALRAVTRAARVRPPRKN